MNAATRERTPFAPTTRGRSMTLKRLFWGLAIAFLIFYVVKYPDQAAQTTKSIGTGLGQGFDKIAEFIKSL
jgi:hypothetical protein